jgi:hypothetical protein
MGDSTTGQNYQFRPSSTELKSVTTGASVYNSVIRHLGTVSGNKLSGAAFSTDMPIILKHNDPWILTWEERQNPHPNSRIEQPAKSCLTALPPPPRRETA